jgi:hypothetical protein
LLQKNGDGKEIQILFTDMENRSQVKRTIVKLVRVSKLQELTPNGFICLEYDTHLPFLKQIIQFSTLGQSMVVSALGTYNFMLANDVHLTGKLPGTLKTLWY